MRNGHHASFVALIMTISIVTSGCAIGGEQSAHVIDPHSVPHSLLGPATTFAELNPGVPSDNITLYLDSNERLIAVNRTVPAPATLQTVLKAMEKGPTLAERQEGLESPLSTTRPILFRSATNGIASVDLPSSFASLGGQDQIIASAQLVYTVTAFPGVDQVVVFINGQPAAVPTSDGSLASNPLRRADYALLAPR
jgi:spore germination protein GerM